MENKLNELFEAFHNNDASRISPLQIILPGYYYIGAVYPTDVVTGKRIALAFLSQQEPFFKSKTIIKLDLSNLYRYSAISDSKHLSASALIGSIIQITGSEPIITDYDISAWQIRWNIYKQITNPKRFLFELESDKQSVLQEKYIESNGPLNKEGEIPEDDIEENSFAEELEIPEEIEDEHFLEELDQLLYDEQIARQIESDEENELLQLLWDDQQCEDQDENPDNTEE